MDMGDRLKKIRKSLSLTQAEFASKLCLTQSSIVMYEKGVRPINNRVIKQICENFKVNEDYLLYGVGEMFKRPRTLDEYAKEKNLSKTEYELIKLYMSIDPEIRKGLLRSLKTFFLNDNNTIE